MTAEEILARIEIEMTADRIRDCELIAIVDHADGRAALMLGAPR